MKFLRPLLAPLLLLGLWSVPPAAAAELIMLERPGCAWCLRWDREIAPIYPKPAEGHPAPLRRVDVTPPWPSDIAGIGRSDERRVGKECVHTCRSPRYPSPSNN